MKVCIKMMKSPG